MWSNSTINRRRETGGASSHGASRDAGVSESDMSAAAAAAAVIVRFIRAWLDLLSVAPVCVLHRCESAIASDY